ncbi:MAG TPA: 7-carboxy-7-deazaguanine synthase [Polyangiaceae bacterium]|nr:MAG: 7-carboxy-7-deazaguanine synthase [Deltaproteobacteria bacterium ADurb.Bin207]HNS96458.1 7-carboxy-7-deazaguanine synthase [Polyangiaceae bacterium]HNZ21417.1 7-carboxy-7-deazaguanine synthase [Polyangiaceae bacterium]HOD23263.1 7-carboxy-7-deazaguanine synthase [Polyangiaceae bacterium]HOE47407.1 7-carboxy-7-deazaguanine synthase [Polyangiaceae bacterium]
MTYHVKTCFRTIQGEGAQTGRVAVFCRLSGCNLWSGRIDDRDRAICKFCDTDFVGTDGPAGGSFATATDLAEHIAVIWQQQTVQDEHRYVVFTGGEPLLQLDAPLVKACHRLGFEVGLETNGTLPCPPEIDWICVSPKAGAPLVQTAGDELKLVFPQEGLDPKDFVSLAFTTFSLQPRHDANLLENIRICLDYCASHPRWRLSVQLHKFLGIP